MTWFTDFLRPRHSHAARRYRSPGDTVQYNINGQLMNVVIPPNLKAGDTFEVSWFWFSVFWQALWALVRLLIANIVRRPVRESNFATPSTRRDVHTHRSASSPSSSRISAGSA